MFRIIVVSNRLLFRMIHNIKAILRNKIHNSFLWKFHSRVYGLQCTLARRSIVVLAYGMEVRIE